MPPDSRPSNTDHPEKDLFLNIVEEQVGLLSPEAKRFYRLRFKSHEELMPWLLREKRSKDLHTDSEMRRQLAYFISKTRYELEKAGYSLTSSQDGSSGDSPTKTLFPKIKSLWHSTSRASTTTEFYATL